MVALLGAMDHSAALAERSVRKVQCLCSRGIGIVALHAYMHTHATMMYNLDHSCEHVYLYIYIYAYMYMYECILCVTLLACVHRSTSW